VYRTEVFIISGQIDCPQPILNALLWAEVLRAHISGIGQGLHFQMHVPLTPGDGYGPPQSLLSAFVVTFHIPEDRPVAREEAPSIVGIGRDQSKSTSNKSRYPWYPGRWDCDRKLRGSHRLYDISHLGVVLEGAA
jgi:hypothetical protein